MRLVARLSLFYVVAVLVLLIDAAYCDDASASEAVQSALQPTRLVVLSDEQLGTLNRALKELSVEEILVWARQNIPALCQVTSFGPNGLVISHMLHKLGIRFPVVFIDTLHLFPESLRHALEASRYFDIEDSLHIYKPLDAKDAVEFEKRYGKELWIRNPDAYDFYAKVEPQRRALYELNAVGWITGRRRDQGGERRTMEILEYDSEGLLTINPLAYWGYDDVWTYIKNFDIPYNPLHDQGYKSIGDMHSTVPVGGSENERAGRWKGRRQSVAFTNVQSGLQADRSAALLPSTFLADVVSCLATRHFTRRRGCTTSLDEESSSHKGFMPHPSSFLFFPRISSSILSLIVTRIRSVFFSRILLYQPLLFWIILVI